MQEIKQMDQGRDEGTQVQQVSLDTYNMLMRHMREQQREERKNAKRINLRAMSYEDAKQYHRLKGRIGK